MQLWKNQIPFRAELICTDGYMVFGDYKNASFLSRFNPLMREQRAGADIFYFYQDDRFDIAADAFSNEIRQLIKQHGASNRRFAVDKIMLHGLSMLEAQGCEIMEGEELT